jgi:hypothetical protein
MSELPSVMEEHERSRAAALIPPRHDEARKRVFRNLPVLHEPYAMNGVQKSRENSQLWPRRKSGCFVSFTRSGVSEE